MLVDGKQKNRSLARSVCPPAFVHFTIVICVFRDCMKTTYYDVILVCFKIPAQPLAGVCLVYFITRKKWISKMLYHLLYSLSFATDARCMSPNLGPSTMAQFCSLFPALPTCNSLLLSFLKLSCLGMVSSYNAYETWEGKTINWQTAFYLFTTASLTTRQKFNTAFSSCLEIIISKMYLL